MQKSITPAHGRPYISIIIPAYQAAAYIVETIESVRAQTRDDWEAIIIDDGSSDNLAEVVEPFLSDRRITLHRFENGGLARARNRGIKLAKGSLVAFLDSDDLYEPEYLERMAAALEAHPDATFVTCDATMFGVADREGHLFSRHLPQELPITLDRVLHRRFNFCSFSMIDAAVLRSVGGFSEDLREAEDLDLWIRLLASGATATYVDAPLARYRRRAGSLSNSTRLLRRSLQAVYFRAMQQLHGRPEEALCREWLMLQLSYADFDQAMTALAAGNIPGGRESLRKALRLVSRPRWRLVLPLLALSPKIATAVVQLSQRRQTALAQLSQPSSSHPTDGTMYRLAAEGPISDSTTNDHRPAHAMPNADLVAPDIGAPQAPTEGLIVRKGSSPVVGSVASESSIDAPPE
jgi:glycosyltransferase involved in cell wall biosynthesis